MLRAAIYSRFSSDQQNPRSAADQTRLCRSFAEAQGWQVVGAFEDHAVSGASRHGRSEYQRLLRDAKTRRFNIVICEALDRLGRKLAEIAEFYDQMAFLGIPVHSVQHGVITPMHIGLLGTMAQMQLADIRSKTTRGLRAVAEDGRSAGGLCYGYRVDAGGDREGRRGHRVVDDAEAAVVRRIFRDYANGLSPKRIALALNAAGVPGPRGGVGRPGRVRGAGAADRRRRALAGGQGPAGAARSPRA